MPPPPPPPPPPPRTGEKDEGVAPDRRRPWTKPAIRTLRIVGTRTGTRSGIDEDDIIGSDSTQNANRATYSPSG